DQREDCVGNEVGDDPVNGLELFQMRDPKRSGKDHHREQHGNRTRALDELEELVNQKCHHQNVDDGDHRHLRHMAENLSHSGSLVGEKAAPCDFILIQLRAAPENNRERGRSIYSGTTSSLTWFTSAVNSPRASWVRTRSPGFTCEACFTRRPSASKTRA